VAIEDGVADRGPLSPFVLVRVESAAILALALYLYGELGESWILFAVLFLIPDLTIPIYFMNRKVGSAAYNLVHLYAWPALLVGIAVADGSDLLLSFGLIWFAHIGADRMLGLGLKYPIDFKQTHIQRL
jgi:hypothetical protein